MLSFTGFQAWVGGNAGFKLDDSSAGASTGNVYFENIRREDNSTVVGTRASGYGIYIDVGSTYTKTIVADRDGRIVARALEPTGFRLPEVAGRTLDTALAAAGLERGDVGYVVATGFGRHQVPFADLHITGSCARPRESRSTCGACFARKCSRPTS